MLAIDELLGRVRTTLDELGVADDTYIVFTSDNGYHLGHYRLMQGKRTAYEPDIRVPLVVAGPGVPAGSASALLASNVDLAPTFLGWAGAMSRGLDGRSLERVLRGREPRRWRRAVVIEHHQNRGELPVRRFGRRAGGEPVGDPDAQGRRMGPAATRRCAVPGTCTSSTGTGAASCTTCARIRTSSSTSPGRCRPGPGSAGTGGSRCSGPASGRTAGAPTGSAEPASSGRPGAASSTTSAAIRTSLHNLAGSMRDGERARWKRRLARLAHYAGATCRRADRLR